MVIEGGLYICYLMLISQTYHVKCRYFLGMNWSGCSYTYLVSNLGVWGALLNNTEKEKDRVNNKSYYCVHDYGHKWIMLRYIFFRESRSTWGWGWWSFIFFIISNSNLDILTIYGVFTWPHMWSLLVGSNTSSISRSN